jgi:YcxB-like protein
MVRKHLSRSCSNASSEQLKRWVRATQQFPVATNSMRLRVLPTPDETSRGGDAYASAGVPPSRVNLFTLVVLILVSAVAFLIARPTWLVTICLSVMSIQAVFLIFRMEARRQTQHAFATDPHADEPYEIEIDPEGVRVWCAHVDTRYRWDGITRVVETPEFYLFLRGASGGTWVPKRLLDSSGDEELRKMIREWSPDRGASLTAAGAQPGVPAA